MEKFQVSILKIFLVSRVVFYLISFIDVKLHRKSFSADAFCSWDCHWYTLISKAGYMSEPIMSGQLKGQANWAFFPLEPLVVRFFSYFSTIDTVLVAEILGNLFLLGGLFYLGAYLLPRFSIRIILVTSALICFSPVNVYFTSFYTEALYFFLLAAFLYYVQENEWLVAAVFANLIMTTRLTGLLVVPIYLYSYFQSRNRSKAKNGEFISGLFLMPIGLLMFMYSLYKKNGDPLAFYNVQKYWLTPDNPFRWVFRNYQSGNLEQIGFISILIGSLCASIYFYKKKMFIEFFLLITICLISFMSNRYSFRFTLGIYPIYLLVANFAVKSRWILIAIFTIESMLLALGINSWIIGHGPI